MTEWNKWRENNFLQQVLLDDVDIEGAFLKRSNLSNLLLKNANMKRVYLEEADLDYSVLWGADLQNAYLARASLQNASNFRLGFSIWVLFFKRAAPKSDM